MQWLGPWYWVMPVAATLAGIFTVAYSTRFVHDVFFGAPPQGLPKVPHEPPRWMKVPIEFLVVLVIAGTSNAVHRCRRRNSPRPKPFSARETRNIPAWIIF